MKPRRFFLALLFLVAMTAPTFAQSKKDLGKLMIEEQFDVKAGDLLAVEVGDADIEVIPGDSRQVQVEVFLAARDMERAEAYFKKQHFTVLQDGHTVSVKTYPPKVQFSLSWQDHPRILVRVHVPMTFDAQLRTSDGDIRIDELEGRVAVKTSDGDISAGRLTGSEVSLATSDGDIKTDRLDAAAVTLTTSDGDIIVQDMVADQATVRTSDGDIRVTQFKGSTLSARSSDGDLSFEELIAQESTLHTSDGDIKAMRVEGDLSITCSDGDLQLGLYKPGTVSARTSDGNISIHVPENLRADVNLRGEEVRVASALGFKGQVKDERAQGTLNGGGRRLEAISSSGKVTLREQ